MNFKEIHWCMERAYDLGHDAAQKGEVPVGAVITGPDGEIISQGMNEKESRHDPSAHAEVLAIKEACKKLKNWRLTGHRLYVTLEPCPMCLSLIQQTRISHLFFGAYDLKGGALSLGFNLNQNSRLNHRFSVSGGHFHYKCSKMMSRFFRERRSQYNKDL